MNGKGDSPRNCFSEEYRENYDEIFRKKETTMHNDGFSVITNLTGFFWGPATVTRLMDDTKHGVWLEVAGAKERLEIRVTRGGRIKVKHEKATAQNTVTPARLLASHQRKAANDPRQLRHPL